MSKRLRDILAGYTMLLPALVLFAGFVVYPLLYGFFISLNKWDGFGPMKFIGFQNYVKVFHDDLFYTSLSHNVIYMFVSVTVKIVLSMCLALLFNRKIRGLTFYRTAYFMPVIISFIAIGMMFQFLLDPNVGFLSPLLVKLGLAKESVLFLGDPNIALFSIIAVDCWKWTGYQTVIFLAGLQTIPEELYESSDIDGASAWQKFRGITLPLLKPVTIINLTLTIMGSFSVFDLVFVMTNGDGGPLNSTHVLLTYMYKITFGSSNSNLGYGSVVAYIVLAIIIVVSVFQDRLTHEKEGAA